MTDELRKVFRHAVRPALWFIEWAQVQTAMSRNEKLLKRIVTKDASTVQLHGQIRIVYPDRCVVGNHVSIHDADWNAMGGISIGNYVHFGPDVAILTASHNFEGTAIPYDDTLVLKPVVIEDYCWIGRGVMIAPGTHIEEGVVVAMGAVVSGRIAKGSIVSAQKHRVVRTRDLDRYEALKAEKKFH